MDRNQFVGGAGQRPEQKEILLVAGKEDPFPVAALDDRTGGHGIGGFARAEGGEAHGGMAAAAAAAFRLVPTAGKV